MNVGSKLLMTVAFCVATVGSTGFGEEVRPMAWPMFAGGLLVVAGLGLREKLTSSKQARGEHELQSEKLKFVELITAVRDRVIDLDTGRATLGEEEVRQGIDDLLANEYFDLTSRNEDLISLIGFSDYARVWEGIAIAERLLARAWSMATDGFAEEGFEELPRARVQLETAASTMAQI